jgi:orotidine-5'-phosphate decarboxylase
VTEGAGRSLFGDRVARGVASRETQLVLGLDPDPATLWPRAAELAESAVGSPARPSDVAARAVAAHCALAIEAAAEHCVAVKFQVACFERLGSSGWTALEQAVALARDHGLLVIADAKRGDIPVSAAAYAQAFFGGLDTPWGAISGLGADALTVNPLLGADALTPLIAAARERGGGVFALVHTSNPGAADLQELSLAVGGSVSDRLAELVGRLGSEGVGAARLSDVGAVVGATAPGWIGHLRERMPEAIFLVPGVGAQGGSVQALGPAFDPGPAGALISASRSIVDAHIQRGGDPAAAARDEAARLRELVWKVAV